MSGSGVGLKPIPAPEPETPEFSKLTPEPAPETPEFSNLTPVPDTREFLGFAPDTRTDTRYIFAKNTVLSAVIDKKLYFTNIYLNILNSKRYYRKYLEKILIINLRTFF